VRRTDKHIIQRTTLLQSCLALAVPLRSAGTEGGGQGREGVLFEVGERWWDSWGSGGGSGGGEVVQRLWECAVLRRGWGVGCSVSDDDESDG
jgi:hypothetical protein